MGSRSRTDRAVRRSISVSPSRPTTAVLTLIVSALVVLMLSGCSEPEPESRILPEPSTALRDASLGGGGSEAARIADYRIEASLDTETHQVQGTARVTWRNATDLTVDTVPFHLYMNGFRSEDTAWMRSSRGRHRSSSQEEKGAWGYIDVESVQLETAAPEDPEVEPSEPVDLSFREDEDPSTMTVDLPYAIGPGESFEMVLRFTTQLPKVVARTGYGDSFHAVAQWYPKIGVLDEDGWEAHTFTVHDEFFADFGNYHVEIEVPSDEIVGATGIRTAEVDLENGRKRLTYEAEMVHDFVWMTDPDFVTLDAEWQGVRIRQLIQPELAHTAQAHEDATIAALESYEHRFGPYPWSTVTIVHPPDEAGGAGGMEYPTFFTTSDRADLPGWVRRHLLDERFSGVYTTVHEFGHQYFQGLFASREHEQPWLDEGLNTMSNDLAYLDAYEDPWYLKLGDQKIYGGDVLRLASTSERASRIPVDSPARAFHDLPGSFGITVYQKTSALMLTLRNLLGDEAFDGVFRAYGEQARFQQPRGEDLEALFISMLGEEAPLHGDVSSGPTTLNLAAFFESTLRTTQRADYAITAVSHRRQIGDEGYQRDEHGSLIGGEAPSYVDTEIEDMEDADIYSQVRVERLGDLALPVEIEVEFEDGTRDRVRWDGATRFKHFDWPEKRVRVARLDPDRKLILDKRRLNNVRYHRSAEDEAPSLADPLAAVTETLSLMILGGFLP